MKIFNKFMMVIFIIFTSFYVSQINNYKKQIENIKQEKHKCFLKYKKTLLENKKLQKEFDRGVEAVLIHWYPVYNKVDNKTKKLLLGKFKETFSIISLDLDKNITRGLNDYKKIKEIK